MSTYELDDDLVRGFIEHQNQAGWGSATADRMAVELGKQLPLPVPTGVGAIVKATYTNGTYVRWTTDNLNGAPWIDTTDGEHLTSEKLGRITKIESEGKELDL